MINLDAASDRDVGDELEDELDNFVEEPLGLGRAIELTSRDPRDFCGLCKTRRF